MTSRLPLLAIAFSVAIVPITSPAVAAKRPTVRCHGKVATIVGTSKGDALRGTPRRDVFAGRGGNDRIKGLGRGDTACGNGGNDVIAGGAGGDLLDGGRGRDRLRGGPGRDRLIGGRGVDTCRGGETLRGCELPAAPVDPSPTDPTNPNPDPVTPTNDPPQLSDASADVATLTLTFNESLGAPPAASAFKVLASGAPRTVTGVAVSGAVLTLTVDTPVWSDDQVTVDLPPISDTAGATSAAQAGVAVRNATAASGFSPALSFPSFVDYDFGGYIAPHVGVWPVLHDRFLPGLGLHRALLIPVDFPDAEGAASTKTPADIRAALVAEAKPWFTEASYGRMTYEMAGPDTWLRMSKNSTEYGPRGSDAQAEALMTEAVPLADPLVDFSQYRSVWVIGTTDTVMQIGLHLYRPWPGRGVPTNEGEVRYAVVGHGGVQFVPNSVVHETGHLLGLPDFYRRLPPDYQSNYEFFGSWDVMADTVLFGAHMVAWLKWQLRWIDPSQLRGLAVPGQRSATLSPIETAGGVKALVVTVSPNKAYVAEVRKQTGLDSDICQEGVLIYSVDSSVPNGEGPGFVYPDEPSTDATLISQCGEKYNAPWAPGGVFTSSADGVTFEVLSKTGDDYEVRATKG